MSKPKTVRDAIAYLYRSRDIASRVQSWDAAALETIETETERLEARLAELTEFAEDVVMQFGYDGTKNGRAVIGTGGLSTLEWAFSVLGWDEPHAIPELECERPDCGRRATTGTPTAGGYWRLCGEHARRIVAVTPGKGREGTS